MPKVGYLHCPFYNLLLNIRWLHNSHNWIILHTKTSSSHWWVDIGGKGSKHSLLPDVLVDYVEEYYYYLNGVFKLWKFPVVACTGSTQTHTTTMQTRLQLHIQTTISVDICKRNGCLSHLIASRLLYPIVLPLKSQDVDCFISFWRPRPYAFIFEAAQCE